MTGVGPDEADTTVVTTGVSAGDVLVTVGVDKLVAGMKVTPRAATRPTTGPAAAEPATTGSAQGRSGGGRRHHAS